MEHDQNPSNRCSHCERWLPLNAFNKRKSGNPQCYCKKCSNKLAHQYRKARKNRDPLYAKRRAEIEKKTRDRIRSGITKDGLARTILNDSKQSARKKKLEHNLTLQNVIETICKPCSYCGDTRTRMSLDRIDNEKGYQLDNVNGACVRCNYLRRDLPYEAWMMIMPGVKAALAAGLLDNWLAGPHNSKRRRLTNVATR